MSKHHSSTLLAISRREEERKTARKERSQAINNCQNTFTCVNDLTLSHQQAIAPSIQIFLYHNSLPILNLILQEEPAMPSSSKRPRVAVLFHLLNQNTYRDISNEIDHRHKIKIKMEKHILHIYIHYYHIFLHSLQKYSKLPLVRSAVLC